MNKIFTLILLSSSFFVSNVFSQYSIRGTVKNEHNIPIASANVIIIENLKNKIEVIHLTDSLGRFSIEAKNISNTKITVKAIGYSEMVIPLNDSILNHSVEIILKAVTINIKEVSISGNKPLVERKLDRLVFNVENSIATLGGDAIDALSKAPGIRVGTDAISIIGKSTLQVMVNNRLLNLSGGTLFAYLRSIPADNIQKIEIITNPPAKYDASGNAGLINIVLKRNLNIGYKGSINTGIILGKYLSTGVTGLFSYNTKKFHVNTNLTGFIGKSYSYTQNGFSRNFNPSLTDDYFQNDSERKSYRASISLDYDISKSSSIGTKYEEINNNINNRNNREIQYSSIALDSIIRTPGQNNLKNINRSVFLYYKKKLDTAGKVFDFDASLLRYNNTNDNQFVSNILTPSFSTLSPSSDVSSLNVQNINVYSTKVDFTFPYKAIEIEFGGKLSFIRTDNDLRYATSLNLLGIQQNTFNYAEDVQSLYFSGEKSYKLWAYKFGLRAENTVIHSESSLNKNKRNYLNLFPTFYVSHKLNKKETLTLSFGRRINRPYYDFLNPFRLYTSLYNYEEGNSLLKPSHSYNYEISYDNSWLNANFYANIIKNGYSLITLVQPNSISSVRYPLNFSNVYQYGITAYAGIKKLKWLSNSNQINLYYERDIFFNLSVPQTMKNFSGYFSTDNTITLNKAKTLLSNIRFFYQFPDLSDLNNIDSYYSLSVGVTARTMKGKITFSLNGNDVLKTSMITSNGSINGVAFTNAYYNDNRTFRFAVVYRFGTNKNSKRFRDSSMEESNRIK